MTPLEKLIAAIIADEGPMRLDRYMGLCLGHPEHGYYMSRDPFGARGDFITAPEISQIFGELIGVWCMAAWQAMGAPAAFNLVELGPGRGTLMADMLRAAAKAMPDFAASAAALHLVETSPVLRALQKKTLGEKVRWHDSIEAVPEGPVIAVANEFFDALPIRQFERRAGTWHERVIGLAEGRLAPGLSPAEIGQGGQDGDVIEFAPLRSAVARQLGQHLAQAPGAALIIDYGHLQTAPGDTLQAMRKHQFVAITEAPGECDITSHVDFEALGKAMAQGGASVHRAITQRDFLLAMGLAQRTEMLATKADVRTRGVLERQMTRLADADQMGNLFKVISATSPALPVPYPFGRT